MNALHQRICSHDPTHKLKTCREFGGHPGLSKCLPWPGHSWRTVLKPCRYTPPCATRATPLGIVDTAIIAAHTGTLEVPATSAILPAEGREVAAATDPPASTFSETVLAEIPLETFSAVSQTSAAGDAARRELAFAGAATVNEASSSGSRSSWPVQRGRFEGQRSSSAVVAQRQQQPFQLRPPPPPPPYAEALTSFYTWPRPRFNTRERPSFLNQYPVPEGKTFNINSFLGKGDPLGGQYLVPEREYREFLGMYVTALQEGFPMYLAENYHQRVYKFFLEFDWDWDVDLALVMEVTPQLLTLATQIASDFYSLPYANVITSIRTPYKVHLNFPQLLTTELLACLCRDRLLETCVERLGPKYGSLVDWERLIDFPHGSLRLMGSRKAFHMDSDPAWVREKAYHPVRLTTDGKWQPGKITAPLMAAASIVPPLQRVESFEKSSRYLDLIYSDLEASQKRMEERQQERARRRAEREQQQTQQPQQQQQRASAVARQGPSGQSAIVIPSLPPGSSKNPLYVRLEVQPDETVALRVHIKSRFRFKNQQHFKSSRGAGAAATGAAAEAEAAVGDEMAISSAAAVDGAAEKSAPFEVADAAPTPTAAIAAASTSVGAAVPAGADASPALLAPVAL